nr:NADH:ubiquinone reductase (Na(+)-transporting) subunit A [Saprospiraceae bacterium]
IPAAYYNSLKEGNDYELFGWLLPLSPRPSISGTIPSFGKEHEYEANTNTHGEKRAFVVTGQYESVLPMDIYPQHLMKAIITNDFEKMEGLGITELTEEDVALCEFVCTSKNPLQSILRQGLNAVQEQS